MRIHDADHGPAHDADPRMNERDSGAYAYQEENDDVAHGEVLLSRYQ